MGKKSESTLVRMRHDNGAIVTVSEEKADRIEGSSFERMDAKPAKKAAASNPAAKKAAAAKPAKSDPAAE